MEVFLFLWTFILDASNIFYYLSGTSYGEDTDVIFIYRLLLCKYVSIFLLLISQRIIFPKGYLR